MERVARWVAAGAAVLLVVGLGFVGYRAISGDDSTYPVTGSVTLDPGGTLAAQAERYYYLYRFTEDKIDRAEATRRLVGTDCSEGFSDTGYDDIRTGAAVTVSNEKGTTVATGDLGPGKVSEPPLRCVFTFSVEVPKAKFYRFEVSHRGGVQMSFDELKAEGWQVSLTLG